VRRRGLLALILLAPACYTSPSGQPADGSTGDGPTGWAAYARRRGLTIANAAAVALPAGFILGFAVDDLDGSPQIAWRMTDGSYRSLPRAVDDLISADDRVWFRLAAPIPAYEDSTGEYYLYDQPDPGTPPTPDEPGTVFDFHDDFKSGALGADWEAEPMATFSLSNGDLVLGTPSAGVRSLAAWGPGTAVDFVLEATSSARTMPTFWGGFQRNGDFVNDLPWIRWSASMPDMIAPDVNLTPAATCTPGAGRPLDGFPHLYTIGRHLDRVNFLRDGMLVATCLLGAEDLSALQLRLHNASAGSIRIEMARVRAIVDPYPTVTLGPPEPRP